VALSLFLQILIFADKFTNKTPPSSHGGQSAVRVSIVVTAESLREVFEKRLNPPAVMPTVFNDIQHKINQTLASMILETTQGIILLRNPAFNGNPSF
jgi:hypothetical protein